MANTRFLADVSESSISIVVKEPARHGIVNGGNAIRALASQFVAAELEFVFAVIHKTTDEQIQTSVIVVVKPDRTGCPARSGDARLCGYIGERAVAVIVIEDALWILGDVKIRKTVRVIVAYSNAHSIRNSADAGFDGHISKGPVTVIVIKRVA